MQFSFAHPNSPAKYRIHLTGPNCKSNQGSSTYMPSEINNIVFQRYIVAVYTKEMIASTVQKTYWQTFYLFLLEKISYVSIFLLLRKLRKGYSLHLSGAMQATKFRGCVVA